MRKSLRVTLGGLALALATAAQPALAMSTAGWNETDRSAATIREFQTRLMVAALRCRAAGIDLLASYNQFIAADRAELTAANARLKSHFKSASPATGDRDYDRYTTSLANGYAGEQWSPESCDGAARLAREAAQSQGNLLAIASRDSDAAFTGGPATRWTADTGAAPQAYADRGPPPAYYGRAPATRYDEPWQSPQADADQGPPAGYYDRGSPPRYRDDSPSGEAYDDRGPPPGYHDQAPSWRDRDDWRWQQAYNDRAPPPAYDDRGPPPGYYDAPVPRGYDGY